MLRKIFTLSANTITHQVKIASRIPIYTNKFSFTSSSDSTQVGLLEEVEAKIFQVLKTAAKCKQSKLTRQATF